VDPKGQTVAKYKVATSKDDAKDVWASKSNATSGSRSFIKDRYRKIPSWKTKGPVEQACAHFAAERCDVQKQRCTGYSELSYAVKDAANVTESVNVTQGYIQT
jgi:hypothetical protein